MSSLALLPWLLILPLAAACLTGLLPLRATQISSLLVILSQALASLLLLLWMPSDEPLFYSLGSWGAPLGIVLRLDGLAAAFLMMTSLIASLCGLYALSYLRPSQQPGFWPLFWFLWAALNGIWLAGDLFNLYVGLELLSLAAVGLVALGGEASRVKAALRYLFAALLGSLGYLLGVSLLYGAHGTLDLELLAEVFHWGPLSALALALILAGLALKTAFFPLHTWLPPAHAGALTPVSALLSALVIKASFYIALRLWVELEMPGRSLEVAQLLGLLGAGALFWGGWMALQQVKLKQVVAYSTVAQLGYLLLIFPLLSSSSSEASHLASQGGWLMLLSHALAKAGMFLAAGNLILCAGRSELSALAGLSRYRPMNIFAFGLAAVSLMGLPPSGGFSAKWLMLQSALISGQWWWILVILLGSLLSAAYLFRVFSHTYLETQDSVQFGQPSLMLELCALTLAALSILLGFFAPWPLAWFALPGPFTEALG